MYESYINKIEDVGKLRNLKPGTIRTYKNNVRDFLKFINKHPEDLTCEDARDFLLYLKDKGDKSSTLNNKNGSLVFFYKRVLGKLWDDNLVPRAINDYAILRVLTREEVERLLDATPNLKYKAMFSLMYSSGLRVSEVIHLNYEDISRTNMQIYIRNSKTHSSRYAILSKRALDILTEYWFKCGKQWKERLNDIRRKQRSYSTDGEYDKPDRGTTGTYGRDVSGDAAEGRTTQFVSGAESKIAGIKQRVAKAVSNLAKYRGNVGTVRAEGWRNSDTERGKSDAESRRLSMERISGEVERREPVIAETEREITELQNRLEKARDVDERFKKLKARRADGGNAGSVREHGAGTSTERYNSPEEGQRDTNITGATERIAELMREAEQREQSRECTSLKERIEANKRIVAEREREKEKGRQYNRGISR